MKLPFAILATIVILCFETTSFSQTPRTQNVQFRAWFIARVVDTDPFTLEYVDDLYHHQFALNRRPYRPGVAVSPQSKAEKISAFRLGEMLSGEFCWMGLNCPDGAEPVNPVPEQADVGVRLPPMLAVNLKKLGSEYKARYARVGTLISYKPHKDNIIQSMTLSRNGILELDSYAGWIKRRLSDAELKRLEKGYFAHHADQLLTSVSEDHSKRELTTIFGKYRSVKIDYSSIRSKPFTDSLDKLIEAHVRSAEYRLTYMWRVGIKDWKYGDVFALDQAVSRGYDYIRENWDRLSKTTVPRNVFEEAKSRYDRIGLYYYRYKGRLYEFSFPTCTDRVTGTWACTSTFEFGKRDVAGRLVSDHDEWPRHLRTRLADVPSNALITNDRLFGEGVAIDRADLETHREFYSRNLGGGAWFREGDNIYVGVKVWFR